MFIKKFHTHFFFNKFLFANDFESLTKTHISGITSEFGNVDSQAWQKSSKFILACMHCIYNDLNRFISLTVDWNINSSLQIYKIVYWSRSQGQILLLKGFTICVRAWCKQWWNAKVYCYYSMLNKVCRIPYFVAHRNFAVSLKI